MVRVVIAGGQTGADRGALDAAIERGVPHGGWYPRGRRAEDGVVLILGFPFSGLVLPGMLLGIDLLFNGTWWLMLAFFVRRPRGDTVTTQPASVTG